MIQNYFRLNNKALSFKKLHYEGKELTVTYNFEVKTTFLNYNKTMHGGAVTTIVDIATTMAILNLDNRHTVSVNLGINFENGSLPGDQILVDAIVRKTGKSLAFTDCILRNIQTNKILCTGQHIKAFLDSKFEVPFSKEEQI